MTAKHSYVSIRFWIQRMVEELQKDLDGGKGQLFHASPLARQPEPYIYIYNHFTLLCIFVVQMYIQMGMGRWLVW